MYFKQIMFFGNESARYRKRISVIYESLKSLKTHSLPGTGGGFSDTMTARMLFILLDTDNKKFIFMCRVSETSGYWLYSKIICFITFGIYSL